MDERQGLSLHLAARLFGVLLRLPVHVGVADRRIEHDHVGVLDFLALCFLELSAAVAGMVDVVEEGITGGLLALALVLLAGRDEKLILLVLLEVPFLLDLSAGPGLGLGFSPGLAREGAAAPDVAGDLGRDGILLGLGMVIALSWGTSSPTTVLPPPPRTLLLSPGPSARTIDDPDRRMTARAAATAMPRRSRCVCPCFFMFTWLDIIYAMRVSREGLSLEIMGRA